MKELCESLLNKIHDKTVAIDDDLIAVQKFAGVGGPVPTHTPNDEEAIRALEYVRDNCPDSEDSSLKISNFASTLTSEQKRNILIVVKWALAKGLELLGR